MTAAHVQDHKKLTITFKTPAHAARFAANQSVDVYAHDDRVVVIVGDSDQIDTASIIVGSSPRVESVNVDWFLN